MDDSIMPSLEHIALVRTAFLLWNDEDIKDYIKDFYFWSKKVRIQFAHIAWEQIEEEVALRVQNLQLPELLKKKVYAFIKPVGQEILKWKKFHELFIDKSFTDETLNSFCWTPHGTIDRKKTAENLIDDGDLGIRVLYQLACIYSLEFEIINLWIRMPKNYKKFFLNFPYFINDNPATADQKKLIIAWTYQITGKYHEMKELMKWSDEHPFHLYGFEAAIKIGNKSSTEFFFKLLSPAEREVLLVRSAGYAANYDAYCRYITSFPEVLIFLLSQMSKEQQIEVFINYPFDVLKSFIDWPWQDFFLKTANHSIEFLSEKHSNFFLNKFAEKINEGHKDYDYQMLIRKFWQQCSENKRRYVIDQCATGDLIFTLLGVYDSENVELILKEATPLQKEKIITSRKGKKKIELLIRKEKWNILEFLLQECILSKEVLVKFEGEFKNYIESMDINESFFLKDVLNKFFELLVSFPRGNDEKICLIKKDFNPAKRYCRLALKSALRQGAPSTKILELRFRS